MKKKNNEISPEEYSKILQLIELEDIFLYEGSIKVNENNSGGAIKLKFADKYSYTQNEEKVDFSVVCKLTGHLEDEKTELFKIESKFKIIYSKIDQVEINDDFFKIFQEISLSIIIWPYIREYIQNNICRAGLPSLTLPLRKVC